jgi:SAM-dependent methyltransferase
MVKSEEDGVFVSPLQFLGPIVGQRILVCGVGMEAVGLAMAGADVYGVDPQRNQVQAVNDLARSLGLRDRIHLQPLVGEQLAYPAEFFDLFLGKKIPDDCHLEGLIEELARVMRKGGRAAFMVSSDHPAEAVVRRVLTTVVRGGGWIGTEKAGRKLESHWSDLNRRPLDYESRALPLSYSGGTSDALARIRTATPFGTTPSR